ncbi:CHAT domain-containing tetratricopeptide repeat protein [Streptomyces sp. NPDC006458]|uniref:CHAT domain-containing tetratricopeptide repeat protein n=1 Tax=Streptomyces sp. NPDC006458 TaxID=3154302 RepID=UPI0033AEE838
MEADHAPGGVGDGHDGGDSREDGPDSGLVLRLITPYFTERAASITKRRRGGDAVRDVWLKAVEARLRQVRGGRDLSAVLGPAALYEAQRLASVSGEQDVRTGLVLGWFHWYRGQALVGDEAETSRQSAVSALALPFAAGVEDLPEPMLPLLADAVTPSAVHLLSTAMHVADPHPLTVSISLWQRIVHCTGDDHPERAVLLSNLASALRERGERSGSDEDLDVAVRHLERAVVLADSDLPGRASVVSNLSGALVQRFERRGSSADLDTAVTVVREAITAIPPQHPQHALLLSHLGKALLRRGERTGSEADLAAAVTHLRHATAALPDDDPERGSRLANIATAMQIRFEWTGSPADLATAVEHFRQAADALPADHPERSGLLANAGAALTRRFERSGTPQDLDSGVELLQQALALGPDPDTAQVILVNLGAALTRRAHWTGSAAELDTAIGHLRRAVAAFPLSHPGRALTLSNLGMALLARFRGHGSQDDLDAGVAAYEQAVAATPVGHPTRGGLLSNLGSALTSRYQRRGTVSDLNAAIAVTQEALTASPADHPLLPALLSQLASVLRARFIRTGSEADLDIAIAHLERAIAATPVDHPALAGRLSNLCNALHSRFQRTGGGTDLDAAIAVGERAVSAAPVGSAERAAFLANLANPLISRFQRDGAAADLDAAIDAGERSVTEAPRNHVDRPEYLTSLGAALLQRHQHNGASSDLDRAVTRLREAADSTPAGHSARATRLSSLGHALRLRFEQTGGTEQLRAAVTIGREAVASAPGDHPDRAAVLLNLGIALRRHGETFQDPAATEQAAACYTEAAHLPSASPSLRIRAGIAAVTVLAASGRTDAAADVAEASVLLLPQVAPRQLHRGDQQRAIGGFAGLASDAAALALAAGSGTPRERVERALRVLEAGRAVLLGQRLQTRSDVTDLRARHPELARRFERLREVLDAPGQSAVDVAALPGQDPRARQRRDAAGELAAVLGEIRALEGFTSFARPPETGELVAQAAQGPVVVFNVSRYRGDALLLNSDGVTALPLPALTAVSVVERTGAFRRAQSLAVSGTTPLERKQAQAELVAVLEWLWDAAAGPVLDALGHGEAPVGEESGGETLPRVWWAPGGLLGLLPLHAAGYHVGSGAAGGRRTVMDRVVSSYTPTVAALRHARERDQAPHRTARSLVVAMPTTPGLPGEGRLGCVDQEATELRALLPNPLVLRAPDPVGVPEDALMPTKANVFRLLPESAFAHFACHGTSDAVDPSRSRLLLHDHLSDPLTVDGLAPLVLDQARLAYLSACHTAAADKVELLDESIHLTSAFQLAGFPHVIGTLWQIADDVALTVARRFYEGLKTHGADLDPRRAAHALHRAVRDARDGRDMPDGLDRRLSPLLWAAHVHAGA